MKRAILCVFHLVIKTKVEKTAQWMELFSGIKLNSLENIPINSTINCNIKRSLKNLALNSTINFTILGEIVMPEHDSFDRDIDID